MLVLLGLLGVLGQEKVNSLPEAIYLPEQVLLMLPRGIPLCEIIAVNSRFSRGRLLTSAGHCILRRDSTGRKYPSDVVFIPTRS